MRITRWAMRLLRYDYEVHYQKGNKSVVADALSRLPTPNPSDCSKFSDDKEEFTCRYAIYAQSIKKKSRKKPGKTLICLE